MLRTTCHRLGRLPKRSFSSSSHKIDFTGVFPIMATPFKSNEQVDLDSFHTAISFMKQAGCNGATIIGVLGESNRMTDKEREQLIKVAVDAAGTMPIIAGTSHAGTYATGSLSQMAQELGAAGVMVTPTKEPAPSTDETLMKYYKSVAEMIPGFPIVLQDHPASTQVHMSLPLMHQMTLEIPEVQCIKLESPPTPARTAMLRKAWADRPAAAEECTILTGLGALYGGFELNAGADGFMTGFAFPEVLQAMVGASQAKDEKTLMKLYKHFLPLMVFEQQPGVAVRKHIYKLRGIIQDGHVRHPAANINPIAARMVEEAIQEALPGLDVTKPITQEQIAAML